SAGADDAAREDLPNDPADGPVARLARRAHGGARLSQARREQRRLRRRACAVDALEDDETTAHERAGYPTGARGARLAGSSSPSTKLSMSRVLPTRHAIATTAPRSIGDEKRASESASSTLT